MEARPEAAWYEYSTGDSEMPLPEAEAALSRAADAEIPSLAGC